MTFQQDFNAEAAHLNYWAGQVTPALDAAVAAVADQARRITDLVTAADDRRSALNEIAAEAGLPLLPDPLADNGHASLIAAARKGPGAAAAALGNAARVPAREAATDAALQAAVDGQYDRATQAAAALLTMAHHDVRDIAPADLVADTDPVIVCAMLARLCVQTVTRPAVDPDAWVAAIGATWGVGD